MSRKNQKSQGTTMTEQTQTPQEDSTQENGQQNPSVTDSTSEQTENQAGEQQGQEGQQPQDQVQEQAAKEPVIETKEETKVVAPTSTTVEQLLDKKPQGVELSQPCQDLIDQIRQSGDKVGIDAIDAILTYSENMKPGRQMNPTDGARHQVNLYRTFQFMVNNESKDFTKLFATVLRIVEELRNGAFGDRYAFRFTDVIQLNKQDINSFTRFLNLLNTASAVKGRQEAIKQIDFSKTLEYGFTDEGRQRILAFFNR